MNDFGDFEPDDAFDTEPPDPLQVAIKLHELRVNAGMEVRMWRDLSDDAQQQLQALATGLIAWLKRQGAVR